MHDGSTLNSSDFATEPITDVWVRTALSLTDVARRLGLREVVEDAENYWAWVDGFLGDVGLNLTRTHTKANSKSDIRISLTGYEVFTYPLIQELIELLRSFVRGPIWCGRWVYRSGEDFDKIVVKEFAPSLKKRRA